MVFDVLDKVLAVPLDQSTQQDIATATAVLEDNAEEQAQLNLTSRQVCKLAETIVLGEEEAPEGQARLKQGRRRGRGGQL